MANEEVLRPFHFTLTTIWWSTLKGSSCISRRAVRRSIACIINQIPFSCFALRERWPARRLMAHPNVSQRSDFFSALCAQLIIVSRHREKGKQSSDAPELELCNAEHQRISIENLEAKSKLRNHPARHSTALFSLFAFPLFPSSAAPRLFSSVVLPTAFRCFHSVLFWSPKRTVGDEEARSVLSLPPRVANYFSVFYEFIIHRVPPQLTSAQSDALSGRLSLPSCSCTSLWIERKKQRLKRRKF